MSRNIAAKNVPVVSTSDVDKLSALISEKLASYTGGKGLPTWKRLGITPAQVQEYVSTVPNLSDVMEEWQNREGVLSKIPPSLLTTALMSAIVFCEDADRSVELKEAWKLATAGQVNSSGDSLTDNATAAGKIAGERAAAFTMAARILSEYKPEQVNRAGQEREDAFTEAFSKALSVAPDMTVVSKLVGTVVNGNTGLAATYGKGGDYDYAILSHVTGPDTEESTEVTE